MIRLNDTDIRILAPIETLDYFDSQRVELARDVSPVEAWNLIMADPQPILKLAFALRDAIATRFGVSRIGGFSGARQTGAQVGDHFDFFEVEHSDARALVLTDRDTHLDVMTSITALEHSVSITSSVQVHNRFGRLYMIPVGVAHKVIVRVMLRRLQRKLVAPGAAD